MYNLNRRKITTTMPKSLITLSIANAIKLINNKCRLVSTTNSCYKYTGKKTKTWGIEKLYNITIMPI